MSKVLWLCSWYPHPDSPYEGDFVQRHAKAVASFLPVTVFYVSQAGPYVERSRDIWQHNNHDNLQENIILFRFRRSGIGWLDKIRYNLRYYATYKSIIKKHIAEQGLPGIVHVHVPMKAGMIARWIKKKWKIPYIVSEQSSHYVRGSKDDFFEKSARHQHNVRKVFQEAAAVTNVSGIIGDTLKKSFSLPAVTVVHNTVDTTLFYYQPHELKKFRFIHVSTLSPHHKNIQGILDAVVRLAKLRSDFELLIVGPVTQDLRKTVAAMGIDQLVRFTGEIPYPDVAMQMKQASAFILFSRYENFPCVVVEALCCGLPVIAADTGGTREAILSSNGMLVQSENDAQLADSMNTLLEQYRLYDRARIASDAAALYNFNSIARKFLSVYREVDPSIPGVSM